MVHAAGFLLLVCILVGTSPSGARGFAPAIFTVTLSDTPTAGDPFQITFIATAVTGTPTSFNWNFGDGQYLNGSAPGNASPVHRYAGPGTFNVTVVVHEGTDSGSQWLLVQVTAAPLKIGIAANPSRGLAPLTVTFTAVIAGGTGTFRSVLWWFGDGGTGTGVTIAYSYVRSGNYLASLNVTDSAGTFGVAHQWVNVSVTGTVRASQDPLRNTEIFAGLGVAGGAAALLAGIWLARWRARPLANGENGNGTLAVGNGVNGPPEAISESPAIHPASNTGPAAPTVGNPVDSAPAGPGTMSEPVPSPPTAPAPPLTAPDPVPAIPAPRVRPPEELRLSQRVVLHLAAQGMVPPHEVAMVTVTQAGMSESLRARQNALTNVLRRLVAAGVLSEELRHVRGQPRRLKVYQLTPRGEALARDLRLRRREPRRVEVLPTPSRDDRDRES
jgi:PKD repeat protein/DNA-binding PadR family transcriptional regulator